MRKMLHETRKMLNERWERWERGAQGNWGAALIGSESGQGQSFNDCTRRVQWKGDENWWWWWWWWWLRWWKRTTRPRYNLLIIVRVMFNEKVIRRLWWDGDGTDDCGGEIGQGTIIYWLYGSRSLKKAVRMQISDDWWQMTVDQLELLNRRHQYWDEYKDGTYGNGLYQEK